MSREFSNMQFDAAVNKAIFGADYLDPSGIFVPIIKGPHVGNIPGETERTFPAVLDISNNYEIRGSLNIKTEQIKGTSYSKDSSPNFNDENVWLNYGQNTVIPNSTLYPGLVVGGPSTSSNSNNAFIWAKRLIQNQNGYAVSDKRIKTDVKLSDYEDAYNKVNNIPVKSYNYLDITLNPNEPVSPAQPFGFIADDVKSQLTNAVIEISGNFTETGALIAPFDNSSNPALTDLNVLDKNSLFQLLFAAFKYSQNKISDLESNEFITLSSHLSQHLLNLHNLVLSQNIILGTGATITNHTKPAICARHIYGKSYIYDRVGNIYIQYDPGTFQDENKDILHSPTTLASNENVDNNNSRKHQFDVYIGGPMNTANLYSFGDMIANFNSSSDQRIKQNITTASTSDAYNLVSQFSLKSYDYVDISRNNTEYGFIAQEVETIFPSAVNTCEGNFTFKGAKISSDDETTTTDFTDMKLLNKDKIMQLLFAAFQESQIKIADLERRLNAIGA
jgi:hypothetical protein